MLGEKIDLLDHGFVRVVNNMGSDEDVVRAARVSYAAAWRAGEDKGSDANLIKYLMNHEHTTPFESVTFTFEVKAPLFVIRQWMRHRTWSFNELSARYRELPREFYIPEPELIGKQSPSSKQARIMGDMSNDEKQHRIGEISAYKEMIEQCFWLYEKLLAAGWPREIARGVIPTAVYSHMFVTVDLLNLLKFIGLRDDEHAQYEIQVYAKALLELIRPFVPVTVSAWEKKYRPEKDV